MTEAVMAATAVMLFGDKLGITAEQFWPAVGIAWLVTYLTSCALMPYRRCPWPWCTRRRPVQGDGRGNYRRKGDCLVCGGDDWRRIGARIIGAG